MNETIKSLIQRRSILWSTYSIAYPEEQLPEPKERKKDYVIFAK